MASTPPQSYQLQRHYSAPDGYARRHQTNHSGQGLVGAYHDSGATQPIAIPSSSHGRFRRHSATNMSHSSRKQAQQLYTHHEVQVYDPAEYLARSPEDFPPTVTITPSPVLERGEFCPQINFPVTTSLRASFETDGSLSPLTATSDSSLASASTAFSEPMSRTNTNDMLCDPMTMMRMDSAMSHVSHWDLSEPHIPISHHHVARHDDKFAPCLSDDDDYHHLSKIPLAQRPDTLDLYGTTMKQSFSCESDSSSSSQLSQSRMARRVHEQITLGKSRPLAPKTKSNDGSSRDPAKAKTISVVAEDGTVRHKTEIPRQPRVQMHRKTTFCTFCNDQPQGFHGDHELRRHIERHHMKVRRVWVCRDVSENRNFLSNCKACRNEKTYGANYNAAAHLRRAHFNPCKNKRGGRGKKSENRGGMGGGNHPSMESLKDWMYEMYEINYNGKVVSQAVMSDEPPRTVGMTELAGYMAGNVGDGSNDSDELDGEYDAVVATDSFQPNFNNGFQHISHSMPTYLDGGHGFVGQQYLY